MSSDPLQRLIELMARLRAPQGGCPWDQAQTFATIAPYTIVEAYEVADAIERGDMAALKDELGDLLFQVVFHARMAEEQGSFAFNDVATAVVEKMIRRHPHVFGQSEAAKDGESQLVAWEDLKAAERASKTGTRPVSALDGLTGGLPALTRALKLQNRAARVGFDWPDKAPVFAKLKEELGELQAEIEAEDVAPERVADEFGDVLFVIANLARHLKLDPEAALRGANAKFERRFRRVEQLLLQQGKSPEASDLQEMDRLWNVAKAEERG